MKSSSRSMIVIFFLVAVAWSSPVFADRAGILEIYQKEVIDRFCKEREWLRCFHEQPEDCEALVEKFVEPCIDKHIASIRNKPDAWQARRVALDTITCFNARFAESHPHGKDPSKECKNAPQHLQ